MKLDALKRNILDFLLYFFCGLPFLRILPISSDMQPYAFIVAVIYLIVYRKQLVIPKIHLDSLWLYLLAVVVAIMDILFDETLSLFTLVRKCYNYAALFLISLALFNSLKRTNGLKEDWVKGLILLWLAVGLVQLLIDREFLTFLVSNYRTSENRGVACLASEPSFYGYVMLFFFVLANEFKRGKLVFQLICLVQIIAIAQSPVTMVYLGVFALMFVVKEIVYFRQNTPQQKKTKLIVGAAGVVCLAVAIFVALKTMSGSRLITAFTNLLRNIGNIHSMADLYVVDASIAHRLETILASFDGFIENWGLPGGFGEIRIRGVEHIRLLSGFGSVIYELGIIGVVLVATISRSLIKGLKNGFVYGATVVVSMFSAIQLGSSVFILVYACAIYAQGQAESTPLDIKALPAQIRARFRKSQ